MKEGRVKNGRLLAAMAEAGLDGVRLAALTGLSTTTISALVCQRRDPKAETAGRIATALSVKACQIWPGHATEVRQ